jgi:hypothetical protein
MSFMSKSQHDLMVPKITVPEPVVDRQEFTGFTPEGIVIEDSLRNMTGTQRGRAWYQLVKIFSIDLTKTHGLPAIRSQFGGQAPPESPLLFNDHPPVEEHRFIDRERVDRLSVPTLRLFVDGINEALSERSSASARKDVLDTRLGSNVGIVALMYMDAAADHFLAQAEDISA